MKAWQRVCISIAIAICSVEICALMIEIIRPEINVFDSPALPRWPVFWISGLGFLVIGVLPHRRQTLLGESLSILGTYLMLLGNNGGFYSSDHQTGRVATSFFTLSILVFMTVRGSGTVNSRRRSRQKADSTRLNETLIGILLLIVLIGYAGLRHLGLNQSTGRLLVLPVVILVAYGIAGIRLASLLDGRGRPVLRFGASHGFLIGAAQATSMAEQFFRNNSRQSEAGSLGIVVLLLVGTVAFVTFQHTRSIRLGIVASIWSAMIGTIIGCLVSLVTNLFLVPYLNRIAGEPFGEHGFWYYPFDMSNTLRIVTSKLLDAPIQAAVLGTVGGLLSYALIRFCSVKRLA